MTLQQTEGMAAAITCIESRLGGQLDLNAVAEAAGYSKYHLHRMFAAAVGMTPHEYIRRRRLTEAARLLVYSTQPVADVALSTGYASQQAFAAIFKALYKKTPREYRERRVFYPLQLEFTPCRLPAGDAAGGPARAVLEDIPDWMAFASLVVGGFPGFDAAEHTAHLRRQIAEGQALLVRSGGSVIAAAAFSRRTGNVGFFAVHPQYRRGKAGPALLDSIVRQTAPDREISISTFRAGDRADTGQRLDYQRLGFVEAELLTEFGYPTQRLVLPPRQGGGGGHG